jgi:peptidoglycan hydrolase CwlO-like protein
MKFTIEELTRANNNGTLESLLLGHGLLPMNVLEEVLSQTTSCEEMIVGKELEIGELAEENDELKTSIKSLSDQLENAHDKIDDLLKTVKYLTGKVLDDQQKHLDELVTLGTELLSK